jgi:adenine C2-methylase RlmN of 23S rRNA A2503 and tRNA A37
MAAASNNKYDILNWIKKVIDSCENMDQLITSYKLMRRAVNMIDDSEIQEELWDYQSAAEDKLFDDKIKSLSQKVELLKG